MTIEAESKHALWVRCTTGAGDVLLIQIDANTGNCLIDGCVGDGIDPDLEPPIKLTLPPLELLALGTILTSMAQSQMEGKQRMISPSDNKSESRKDQPYKSVHCIECERLDRELQRRMSKPVYDLEMSVRSRRCLKSLGLVYLGDVAKMTEDELMRVANVGRKSVNEIKEILANHGLSLDADVSSWKRPV